MAIAPAEMIGFAMLASMKRAERVRAQTPLIMTMIPGPPAQRAAVATVAVSTQARDAVRREQQVAVATVTAVAAVARGTSTLQDAWSAQPALRDVDLAQVTAALGDVLEDDEEGTGSSVPATTDGVSVKEYRNAVTLAGEMVVAALGMTKGTQFSHEDGRAYDAFLDLLDGETRDLIVKPD